jgi:hypothetical protein
MENRQYMIFSLSEVDLINFNEVLQTSAETLRKSNDNTKSFVKWEGKIITSFTNSLLHLPALDENGQIAKIESEPSVDLTMETYIPDSIKALTTKQGPYTHTEILLILAGSNWTDPNPIA